MRPPCDSDDHVDAAREAMGLPTRGKVRVFKRECRRPSPSWRHYEIIRDGHVTLIEMRPAEIAGWNVRCVTEYGSEAWGDMVCDAIVAWKRGAHPDDDRVEIDRDLASIEAMLARWRREQAADGIGAS